LSFCYLIGLHRVRNLFDSVQDGTEANSNLKSSMSVISSIKS